MNRNLRNTLEAAVCLSVAAFAHHQTMGIYRAVESMVGVMGSEQPLKRYREVKKRVEKLKTIGELTNYHPMFADQVLAIKKEYFPLKEEFSRLDNDRRVREALIRIDDLKSEYLFPCSLGALSYGGFGYVGLCKIIEPLAAVRRRINNIKKSKPN